MAKKISDINSYIENKRSRLLIESAENFHEMQYMEIMEELMMKRGDVRLVCIAGPSSSGKTIFSNTLRKKLADMDIGSYVISMDDYFCDKENLLADESGNYDFESIEIIETILFSKQLGELIDGKEVLMPRYNFHIGKKEFDTKPTRIEENSFIFIEGIHALNYDVLFSHVDRRKIFGIYIIPQEEYETSSWEIIKPHDVRLIRRIIRDTWYRNCNIIGTLKMWDNVRAGEHKYIFPNKKNADYEFNSSLDYELSIMKKFLLEEYEKISPQEQALCDKYINKKALKELCCISAQEIPQASILNEFIPKTY